MGGTIYLLRRCMGWHGVMYFYFCMYAFFKKNIMNSKLCKILFCGFFFSVKIIMKFSLNLGYNWQRQTGEIHSHQRVHHPFQKDSLLSVKR